MFVFRHSYTNITIILLQAFLLELYSYYYNIRNIYYQSPQLHG